MFGTRSFRQFTVFVKTQKKKKQYEAQGAKKIWVLELARLAGRARRNEESASLWTGPAPNLLGSNFLALER